MLTYKHVRGSNGIRSYSAVVVDWHTKVCLIGVS